MNATENKMLSEREAAELLGIATGQLKMARTRGALGKGVPVPPFYQIGRSIRYRRDELLEWLEARRVEPRPPEGGTRELPKIRPPRPRGKRRGAT